MHYIPVAKPEVVSTDSPLKIYVEWQNWSTLIEQSDQDSLKEQSHHSTLIAVVLLEIMYAERGKRNVKFVVFFKILVQTSGRAEVTTLRNPFQDRHCILSQYSICLV